MKKLTEEQKKIITAICSKTNFDDSLELFISNMHLLSTVSIIKSNQNESGIDLYEPFKDIPGIENHLYTPFVSGKVNFINNNIVIRYLRTGNAFTRDQRTISFDTQTVSYLKRYYDGKQKELPQNLNSVFKLMCLEKIGVNYFPYTFENLLYENSETAIILDNLYVFEKLYHDGKKSDKYCKKRAISIMNSYEKMKETNALEELNQLYKKVYVSLLSMINIQLKYPQWPLDKKMESFYKFMNEELNLFIQPEINVAYNYFSKGQNYTFFGKIQRNSRDLIGTIKNMAWDLFHLRFMEWQCKIINLKKVDMLVPYMFTYDKNLLEVKECYELNALAVSVSTNERFPFYSNNSVSEKHHIEYFNPKEVTNRRLRLPSVIIDNLISKYEKAITL